MIQYITRGELRAFASKLTSTEQRFLKDAAAARRADGTTFLSHSSKDGDLVVGAVRVLEGHGATVYIDEVDPDMPPYTTGETASLLKDRIRRAKRFVLLASVNSKDSRWVPWELGVADGYNGLDKIALFPASDSADDKTWASWEYLGLYRRIVWGDLQGRRNRLWMVLDEGSNTATPLDDWLSG